MDRFERDKLLVAGVRANALSIDQAMTDELKSGGDVASAALDVESLTVVVREVLGRPAADVDNWRMEPLRGMGWGAAIVRVSGTARDRRGPLAWSLVRKRVWDAGDEPDSLSYWRREPLAYASGLLEELVGVRAPRCYAQSEESDAIVLWLEDLVDDADGSWTLERFGQAARDLGRFGGAYARGIPVPDYPWLSRRWLAPWVEQAAAGFHTFREALRDPLLSQLYPPEVASVMVELWEARERILSVLARQRPVLSHLDAVPANLMLRARTTYLIDWAFVGHAALGEDLAPLVGGSAMFGGLPPEYLPAIDKVAFPAYLAGLRTSGWDGDPALVRFVYCAAAALRCCIGPTTWYVCGINADGTPADVGGIRNPQQRALYEDLFGQPFTHVLHTIAASVRFLALHLGVEALNLLPDYEPA